MMAEFLGDVERLLADAYPYRWPIAAGVLILLAALGAFVYRMGWHEVIWRFRLPVAIVATPVLALTLFLGYDLGSPLFTNKTVEEEFPFAFTATVPSNMSRSEVERIMELIAQVEQEAVEEEIPIMDEPTDDPPDPPAALEKLRTGSFRDQDNFHKGSGQATIYRGPDGSLLLRLEDLDVTNGPDLHVLLSPHPDPSNSGEVKTPGYVDLGKLKGNRGNQNYPILEDIDVAAQGSVIIYCKPFKVVFSVASLQDAS